MELEEDRFSRKIIIAVTGASGAVYAKRLLERIGEVSPVLEEVAVIFSETALQIWEHEQGGQPELKPPAKGYDNNSFFAPFASGSALYDTMVICPASMGVIGRIAGGTSDDLIARAADVILKERRRLILVPRESPYNLIHIKNMETLTLAGAIICPASPSFYSKPATVEELVDTIVNRVLALAGFKVPGFRWMEND